MPYLTILENKQEIPVLATPHNPFSLVFFPQVVLKCIYHPFSMIIQVQK